MSDVRFCWLCGNKLWGKSKEELTIDTHLRTLHKTCAKDIKREFDFHKNKDGTYSSMEWTTSSEWERIYGEDRQSGS